MTVVVRLRRARAATMSITMVSGAVMACVSGVLVLWAFESLRWVPKFFSSLFFVTVFPLPARSPQMWVYFSIISLVLLFSDGSSCNVAA